MLSLVLLTPLIVNAPYFGTSGFLPHSFFPFIVGKAVYSRTLIEIAFGLWVVLAIRSPEYRIPRSWLLVAMAVYLVVALLASLLGVSPQRSLWSTYERMQGFVDLAHWLSYVLLLGAVFRSWPLWRSLLNFNLAVAFIMSVLGIGELRGESYFTFIDPAGKLHITLGNSTYVGAYYLVNILIALGFLVHSYQVTQPTEAPRARRRSKARARRTEAEADIQLTRPIMRAFWILVIVLGTVMVLQSGTRGALIGLGSGFLAFAIGYVMWGRAVGLKRASLAVIVGLVGLGLLIGLARNTAGFQRLVADIPALHRLSTISLTEGSFSHRINTGIIGLQAFADRPILGWGPENFTIGYDRFVKGDVLIKQTQSFDQAHNKVIEELTTKGILGFLGYSSIWFLMFLIFARRTRKQNVQQQVFTLFVGSALVGYFVQNLALFDTPGTVGQFMLLVGFALYLETTSDEDAGVVPDESTPPDNVAKEGAPALARAQSLLGWALRPAEPPAAAVGSGDHKESPLVLPLQLATAVVLVLTAILVLNVTAYQASRTIIKTLNPNISWSEKLDYFDETIQEFPQLANYPRLVMYNQLTRDWPILSDEEKRRALAMAEEQSKLAFEEEPEEWRLYGTLAGLYQRIGRQHAEKSRTLVEKVAELAPDRMETVRLQVSQNVLERNYEGAQKVIDEYVDRYPEAESQFESLRGRVDQAAEAAKGS